MPRIRSVHPDICVSDTMASLDAGLERTFVRLWTHCDDEGRCEDRPKILKAALYPLHDKITPESLDEELTQLAQDGLILRYVVDGVRLIQVTSWDEYQKPQKPRPSKYAAPPVPRQDEDDSPPESDVSGVGEGEGDRSTEVGEEDTSPPAEDDSFADFWKLYPPRNGKKVDKAKAHSVWRRLNNTKRARALVGVGHYAEACRKQLTIAKDAHRWLRDECWVDWQTPAQSSSNGQKDPYRSVDEALGAER